jgi:hypothetical protein
MRSRAGLRLRAIKAKKPKMISKAKMVQNTARGIELKKVWAFSAPIKAAQIEKAVHNMIASKVALIMILRY